MARTLVKKVYVLNGGSNNIDASAMIAGHDYGHRIDVPVIQWLVETELGYVLVDTGFDPNVMTDPAGTWGAALAAAVTPTMKPENQLYAQLETLNVAPEEVKVVIYTHLHHDHAGGARLFPKATHIAQKSEYRWAYYTDRFTKHIYLRTDFDYPELKWFLVDGDVVLLPGLQILYTPGHTPGHQSVVLWDVPDVGTVILCGDAIYMMDNVRLDQPQSIVTDTRGVMESMHRLTALAEAQDGTLFVGHDMEFLSYAPVCPKPLERLPEEKRRFWQPGLDLLYPSGMPLSENEKS
jgi:N-acyl homoserine lactone hydrolase